MLSKSSGVSPRASALNISLMPIAASKRTFDLADSPEMLSKKLRITTLPACAGRSMDQLELQTSPWRRSIGGDNTFVLRSPSFTERTLAPVGCSSSFDADRLPDLSSFRPEAVNSQGLAPKPVTSKRNQARRISVVDIDEFSETTETPVYARYMHLVDGEDSIYKKDHGDEWRENALCLYCFRRHGDFSKLSKHGYGKCGRNEPLESHYWE
jgi:hypothetical protein